MRLIYHAGIGDWVVLSDAGQIVAAMSWDEKTALSQTDAEEWFRDWLNRTQG